DATDADIIVVNTCSFIDSAKQESVNTILEMAKHKIAAGGRARKLIVAGCLVERYRDDIIANIPEVDAVVGTGELDAILAAAGLTPTGHTANSPFTILTADQISRASSAVQQHSRPESNGAQLRNEALLGVEAGFSPLSEPATDLGFSPGPVAVLSGPWAPNPEPSSRPEGDARESSGRFSRAEWHGAAAALPTYLADEYTPRILSTPRASAYIKIAEGCDHPCTFCIIPQLRGKFRSRRIGSIMAEAQNLIAQGVREITLIGQDTTCYGEDLGLTDGLAQLLEALAGLEGMRWLRFLYTYPNKVTTRLLETMAKHNNIAKYLDVPLQHASAPLLKSMKRGGNAEIFLKLIDKARQIVPGIAIRSTFIVGFPGETQDDFDILCDFVQAAEIDWLGVFSYSDEEGAAAFNMPAEGKVPKRTIEARRRKLMKLQQKISTRKKAEWVGREVDLLVEGESEETELLWEGRTILHAPEIDGKVFINDFEPHETLVPGTFYRAEITESHDYDLVARIIE
ncbi:MAG TPA: 30S ribosomal protein S12 methylthiotransferase RimO, partial [Acidobacteriaceae bacterium]|nr:30S ribosomal protein S12 methylthiotransferase RimO [Acidobacteriaceae bacterium]